jgi:twitching motility protein PilT
MVCTPAISATIRDDKIHQIYGLMQAGQKYGMQTMNQALYRAVMERKIARGESLRRSSDTIELEQMFGEKNEKRRYQFKK